MTAIKTTLNEVDAYHTPFFPRANVQASNLEDAIRLSTGGGSSGSGTTLKGQFALATNANSTTLTIAGLLSTSFFDVLLQNGAGQAASEMRSFITIGAQSNGSITLNHPSTSDTLNYNYKVDV
jgi:hypothetical protein